MAETASNSIAEIAAERRRRNAESIILALGVISVLAAIAVRFVLEAGTVTFVAILAGFVAIVASFLLARTRRVTAAVFVVLGAMAVQHVLIVVSMGHPRSVPYFASLILLIAAATLETRGLIAALILATVTITVEALAIDLSAVGTSPTVAHIIGGFLLLGIVAVISLLHVQGTRRAFAIAVERERQREDAHRQADEARGQLERGQRMEAMGRLAGGVAHDFNNLLLVVMGHAEMLADEAGSDSPDAEHVRGIRVAADRAAELTRQLLSFSRGQPAQMRATDIGALVEDLGGLLKQLTGEHISLELVRPDEPHTVLADPSQLEQIVMNLAANARDAMPSGGTLRISVGRREITAREAVANLAPGGYVGLTVTDSGGGMTPDQLDRAFDPFYTTKPIGKGTGLGLATVHAVAEQNHGHASIASSPGVGTTVEVLLPLCDRSPVARREIAQPMQARGGGETILLVEDEPAIRNLLETSLQNGSYRVVTAEGGQEALEHVARMEEPIDLLVTDVVMPRMSGPELARRLSQTRPRLQVLYMSGYSQESDLGVMAELDHATVLQKPFSPKEFLREVRRVLDEMRRGGGRRSPLKEELVEAPRIEPGV